MLKITYKPLSILFLTIAAVSFSKAQTIQFRTGDVRVEKVTKLTLELTDNELENGFAHRFVTFAHIPEAFAQNQLRALGLVLLEYIPQNTYLVKIPTSVDPDALANLGVVQVLSIGVAQKMSGELHALSFKPATPEAEKEIYFQLFEPSLASLSTFVSAVNRFDNKTGKGHAVLAVKDLKAFAAMANVKYVEAEPPVGEPESDDGRNLHRSNVIDVDYWGGRRFNGSGVRVAVNDDGFVGPHIDFKGRTEQAEVIGDLTGTHGDGVAGIIGAAGNLNPRNRGMATGAELYIRPYDSEMLGTTDLFTDSNVVIFNSSYSNGCNAGYTLTTQLVDQELNMHPTLMQVFSAGNSNGNDCDYGAGNQWGNITGGHKAGKNVLAVANLQANDSIAESSSRGPASDGRIKPDIAAHGALHVSNLPNNLYSPFGGTSAAAPGVAGVLAQLHQAYRQLYLEEAPAGLLKCILLNTATDLGNQGPDFIHGWGKVNALRALRMLEEGRFGAFTVNSSQAVSSPIQIPPGVKQAKIMVYWPDKEASTTAANALVNDLDITVEDPSTNMHLPYVLDPAPLASALQMPATQGVDHLNNMEQVPLFNPAPGLYVLNVNPTTVPFGDVTYYMCYEFLTDDVTLTYPLGGEGWEPGTTERIHWDAHGTTDDFDVAISFDNGGNWQSIATVPSTERFVAYTVPNNVSAQVKVRVNRGGFSDQSDTTFSIIGVPQNLQISNTCHDAPNYNFNLTWDAVVGADAYDVYMLGNMYMDSLTTESTTASLLAAPDTEVSWFSVRARNANGAVGTRAIAVPFGWEAQEESCVRACSSSEDVGVESLLTPVSTSFNCNVTSVPVTIVLQNRGATDQSNFQVNYQLGGQLVTETVSATVPMGGAVTYTFTQEAQAPAIQGQHELKVWTALASDQTTCNDSIVRTITYEDNVVALPISEDFQGSVFPSSGYTIVNPDDGYTWQPINVTGASGSTTKAMYVDNWSYSSEGQRDYFRLPVLSVGSALTAKMYFDVAYRPYNNQEYNDTLRVEVSTDCGMSFQQVYQKDRYTLATGNPISSGFAPIMDEWRTDTIDLAPFIGQEIMVQFVNVAGFGNKLYVDNINVNGSYLGISEIDDFDFAVYPNPTSHSVMMTLPAALTTNLTVHVLDLLGKPVLVDSWLAGNRKKELSISGLAKGQYFIQLRGNHIKGAKKVAKL